MFEIVNVSKQFVVAWPAVIKRVAAIESSVEKIRDHGWGGWSLMSESGEYTDGWANGSEAFAIQADNSVVVDVEGVKLKNGFEFHKTHQHYTKIATPELIFICEQAKRLGYRPSRVRITHLESGAASAWHVDDVPSSNFKRLHFVIRTNPKAVFKYRTGEQHLPARNVFLIDVCHEHQIENLGDEPRVHIIMDTNGPGPKTP